MALLQVSINGQERDIPEGMTVAELLRSLDIKERHVAVEVNLELVPRARHRERVLAEGDRLEVVTLVGGG